MTIDTADGLHRALAEVELPGAALARTTEEARRVTPEWAKRFEADCRRAFALGLYERHIPWVSRPRHPNAALLNHVRGDR